MLKIRPALSLTLFCNHNDNVSGPFKSFKNSIAVSMLNLCMIENRSKVMKNIKSNTWMRTLPRNIRNEYANRPNGIVFSGIKLRLGNKLSNNTKVIRRSCFA